MPAGSTGETREGVAGWVGVMTGTGFGTATGVGGGGTTAAFDCAADVGVGWPGEEREKIRALSDAPAAADVAATMARVVFDMPGTEIAKLLPRVEQTYSVQKLEFLHPIREGHLKEQGLVSLETRLV